jgi:hypothetical protein
MGEFAVLRIYAVIIGSFFMASAISETVAFGSLNTLSTFCTVSGNIGTFSICSINSILIYPPTIKNYLNPL